MYLSFSWMFSKISGGRRKFSATTALGVCSIHSFSKNVLSSEKSPLSNTSRNSVPFSPKPWRECGCPEGKYHRSPSLRSSMNEPPSVSSAVTRTSPVGCQFPRYSSVVRCSLTRQYICPLRFFVPMEFTNDARLQTHVDTCDFFRCWQFANCRLPCPSTFFDADMRV
jgi:hypothetical protein